LSFDVFEADRLIARGGRGFVGLSAAASAVALPLQLYIGVAFLCLTAFLACVFRDPKRSIGTGLVSPADGVVREVDSERGLVSIYLALRNVHVTRAPVDGEIERSLHIPGKHKPAFAKGTPSNERLELSIRSNLGRISMVQMTGAIARRFVPYVDAGQAVDKGTKLSLIRFGSRVDVFLPPKSVRIAVRKGQRLRAGVTCIAEAVDGRLE
jgi:phosphatidylserine decarboxylase